MRVAVTGTAGQVASALRERGPLAGIDIIALGRPDLDLADHATIAPALAAARPDVIVSAAAYTAVDKAESEPARAFAINAEAPRHIAHAARRLGVPLIHLSTDYVFDGRKAEPYVEDDATNPLSVYGASKLAGEAAIAGETGDFAILRTAWVYSAFGHNFLKTMLRLAADQPVLRVVADQRGCPTSADDIATAILAVAHHLVAQPQVAELRGIFHLAGTGDTSWVGFAEEIFSCSAAQGGPTAQVEPITTADYPTPARRPANSRLDTAHLRAVHGVSLPAWRPSVAAIVARLISTPARVQGAAE